MDKVTYHPDYNSPAQFRNDIAVIKLKGKVVENGKFHNQISRIHKRCIDAFINFF